MAQVGAYTVDCTGLTGLMTPGYCPMRGSPALS